MIVNTDSHFGFDYVWNVSPDGFCSPLTELANFL